jgi:hypothetical protein
VFLKDAGPASTNSAYNGNTDIRYERTSTGTAWEGSKWKVSYNGYVWPEITCSGKRPFYYANDVVFSTGYDGNRLAVHIESPLEGSVVKLGENCLLTQPGPPALGSCVIREARWKIVPLSEGYFQLKTFTGQCVGLDLTVKETNLCESYFVVERPDGLQELRRGFLLAHQDFNGKEGLEAVIGEIKATKCFGVVGNVFVERYCYNPRECCDISVASQRIATLRLAWRASKFHPKEVATTFEFRKGRRSFLR